MFQNIDITTNEQALITSIAKIPDPRVKGRSTFRLVDIIFISICAILCGAKHWNEIAEFGRQRMVWFQKYLPFLNDIPSHKTFCRVFSLIPAQDLLSCLLEWSGLRTPLQENDIIAIDGKTLRKSGNKNKGNLPLHLINAYVTNRGITLAAMNTPDKSNEIKGIPPLLKSLPIKDCIITIVLWGRKKVLLI